MSELELIIDFYSNTERQGPGSTHETLKAINSLKLDNNEILTIADIGCGSGGQTITLAKNLHCKIAAVDLFPQFLNELNEKATTLNLQHKINTLENSMETLPFKMEEFDIIWSEGAIYNMGFENGIKNWRHFLKTKGYLAISEITWTTKNRPNEIENFWNSAYPEIDTAANKIKILESNGFKLLDCFFLKKESWILNFYKPILNKLDEFLERNNHNKLAKKIVADFLAEYELYKKYNDYFNYGFYISQKK